MLKPTEKNDGEFWWVKDSYGLEVVQISADESMLRTWGEPMFFVCGNECEKRVSKPGLVWIGKAEPPKEVV